MQHNMRESTSSHYLSIFLLQYSNYDHFLDLTLPIYLSFISLYLAYLNCYFHCSSFSSYLPPVESRKFHDIKVGGRDFLVLPHKRATPISLTLFGRSSQDAPDQMISTWRPLSNLTSKVSMYWLLWVDIKFIKLQSIQSAYAIQLEYAVAYICTKGPHRA